MLITIIRAKSKVNGHWMASKREDIFKQMQAPDYLVVVSIDGVQTIKEKKDLIGHQIAIKDKLYNVLETSGLVEVKIEEVKAQKVVS